MIQIVKTQQNQNKLYIVLVLSIFMKMYSDNIAEKVQKDQATDTDDINGESFWNRLELLASERSVVPEKLNTESVSEEPVGGKLRKKRLVPGITYMPPSNMSTIDEATETDEIKNDTFCVPEKVDCPFEFRVPDNFKVPKVKFNFSKKKRSARPAVNNMTATTVKSNKFHVTREIAVLRKKGYTKLKMNEKRRDKDNMVDILKKRDFALYQNRHGLVALERAPLGEDITDDTDSLVKSYRNRKIKPKSAAKQINNSFDLTKQRFQVKYGLNHQPKSAVLSDDMFETQSEADTIKSSVALTKRRLGYGVNNQAKSAFLSADMLQLDNERNRESQANPGQETITNRLELTKSRLALKYAANVQRKSAFLSDGENKLDEEKNLQSEIQSEAKTITSSVELKKSRLELNYGDNFQRMPAFISDDIVPLNNDEKNLRSETIKPAVELTKSRLGMNYVLNHQAKSAFRSELDNIRIQNKFSEETVQNAIELTKSRLQMNYGNSSFESAAVILRNILESKQNKVQVENTNDDQFKASLAEEVMEPVKTTQELENEILNYQTQPRKRQNSIDLSDLESQCMRQIDDAISKSIQDTKNARHEPTEEFFRSKVPTQQPENSITNSMISNLFAPFTDNPPTYQRNDPNEIQQIENPKLILTCETEVSPMMNMSDLDPDENHNLPAKRQHDIDINATSDSLRNELIQLNITNYRIVHKSPQCRRKLDLNVETLSPATLQQPPKLFTNSTPLECSPIPKFTPGVFTNMGPFFGLPLTTKYVYKHFKKIDTIFEWQANCFDVFANKTHSNLIYVLPMIKDKTTLIELLILRELICYHKNVIYVCPNKSLVQEAVYDLSPFALSLNFLVEEYTDGKGKYPPRVRSEKQSIFVCTVENGALLFDSLLRSGRTNEIGLILVDDLNLLGDAERGSILEITLTKILYIAKATQIIGLTSTRQNATELAEFLNAAVHHPNLKAVPLREFVKCGNELFRVNYPAASKKTTMIPSRTLKFNYTAPMRKMDNDQVAGLVMDVTPEKNCLIFCHTKKSCENLAVLLTQFFPDKYLNRYKNEKLELLRLLSRDTASPVCKILIQTIPFGVAYIHSGILHDERKHLEEAYRQNVLCVICYTSSLANTIYLSAARVIIRSLRVGRDIMDHKEYREIICRTRYDESILICQSQDEDVARSMLMSKVFPLNSTLTDDNNRGIELLILSAIDLGIVNTRPSIVDLFTYTLLKIQSNRVDVNIPLVVDNVLKNLYRNKAMEVQTSDVISMEHKSKILIKSTTAMELNILGRAAVRAFINFDKSMDLFENIIHLLKNVCLCDHLHLIYIIIPKDKIDETIPSPTAFSLVFGQLNPSELQTSKLLGIPESSPVKLMTGRVFKPEDYDVLKRFYLALIIKDLWNRTPYIDVANKFEVERGFVESLIPATIKYAKQILRFCSQFDSLWAFTNLLASFINRLSNCCAVELVPLVVLPSLTLGRARLLYNAGYRTVDGISAANHKEMARKVESLSEDDAKYLIAVAKCILTVKFETSFEIIEEDT